MKKPEAFDKYIKRMESFIIDFVITEINMELPFVFDRQELNARFIVSIYCNGLVKAHTASNSQEMIKQIELYLNPPLNPSEAPASLGSASKQLWLTCLKHLKTFIDLKFSKSIDYPKLLLILSASKEYITNKKLI